VTGLTVVTGATGFTVVTGATGFTGFTGGALGGTHPFAPASCPVATTETSATTSVMATVKVTVMAMAIVTTAARRRL
jgi:hypothetical protein